MQRKFKIGLSILAILLFCYIDLSSLMISSSIVADTCLLLRRARLVELDFLLKYLTPEIISKVESPAKFVIHSASSGTGQGTIKESLLEKYGDRFQKFLLYTTRARRGIEFKPSDPRYAVVKEYIDTVSEGLPPPSVDELLERYNLQGLSEREKEDLRNILEPNWTKILAGAPRTDIPSLSERFEITPQGTIKAYTEFNGVHYWFVSEEELFKLRDEKGVIVEPVREHFQGLDLTQIEEAFKAGNGKIFILEGDRVWFDHVIRRFPNVTSIFIAPISDAEFKERMIAQLGEEQRDTVMALDLPKLLQGGIERYIRETQSVLIKFPDNLTPQENVAFLNIRNAIISAVGYKITHPEIDVESWLISAGLVKDSDLQIVRQKIGLALDFEGVVEIINRVYKAISSDPMVLSAMRVIISEMAGRIENRLRSQNQNPEDPRIAGNTYARAGQSPREYAGSVDYGSILINRWGQLDVSVEEFTRIILKKLWEDIQK